MESIIALAAIIAAVGGACIYIKKKKKKGIKCIGCPCAGGCRSCDKCGSK